ncbi:unnamed protein product [Prunus brigantina]
MEMRLVACERMSGTQCSKKTPLSSCFGKQLVCNGDEAFRASESSLSAMEMGLVACERMSGTQCSKKTPLSSCFGKQFVCNGDEACRLLSAMEMRLVACERMSGTQCSKSTPLSSCFGKQLVCNGDEASCSCIDEINNKGNIKTSSSLMEVQEARRPLGAKLSIKGVTSSAPRSADHHKVSRLELSDLGLLIVVGRQLLLVGGNSDNGLLSFFFEQIKVDFHLFAVLVKTAHLNAHGRDCDVWGDDCFCPIGQGKGSLSSRSPFGRATSP